MKSYTCFCRRVRAMVVPCLRPSLSANKRRTVKMNFEPVATELRPHLHFTEDLLNRLDRLRQLLVGIVEVRREAYASLGTVIHQHITLEQLGAHLLGVRHVNRHGAATTLSIAWSVDAPAAQVRHLDEQRGLPLRLLADLLNTHFGDDLHSWARYMQRWNIRRALREAIDAWRVARWANLEAERILVSDPAGEGRLQFLRQVRPYVKVRRSRPAAQPLEYAAGAEIHIESLHIERQSACCLEGVEQHICANSVRFLDDGLNVLDERATEDDVRDGNDERLVVDGIEQALGVDVDTVIIAHHLDACAARALRLPEVHDRGKVQVSVNHLIAPAAEVETRRHRRLTGGHVLQAGDRTGGRIHQRANLIANLRREHPPFVVPGANAARAPHVRVAVESV